MRAFTFKSSIRRGALAAVALALTAVLPAAAQTLAVTDFEDGTVQGWVGLGVRDPGLTVATAGAAGGSGDHYLRFVDRASVGGIPGLTLLAPPPFRGDYTGLAQRCGALELDVRVFEDQGGALAFRMTFDRDADGFGAGAAPEARAVFRLAEPIDESSGWVHVVVPLHLLDAGGNLPANASGSWEMAPGHPASAWNLLLAQVDHVSMPFEINSGTFEEIGIDNVRLVAGDCDCPAGEPAVVRHAGRADDFALPTERVAVRRELVADYPGVTFKTFDDPARDAVVAHTFDDLPAGIARAELEIRMQASFPGSSNDALYLGYLGARNFAYGARIFEDLPAAGGSWDYGDPAATFVLDLADLPGGGNLMPQLTSERRLDLMVQDDTAVDFARLHLWVCPPPVDVGGLGFDPGVDTTVLPNLAGGADFLSDLRAPGFTVDLDAAEGICLGLEQACVGADEASHLALTGKTSTLTDTYTQGTLSLDATGGGVTFSVDFEPDLPVIVKVGRADPQNPGDPFQDEILDERWRQEDGAVAEIPGTACVQEIDFLGFCFRVWLAEPVAVKFLPDGPTVVGDVIHVCHDIVVGVSPRFSSFSLETEGWDGPLRLAGAKVLQLGLLSQALGTAVLQPFDGGLVVGGIGASGGDGVAFDLTDAAAARLRWSPLDALEAPPAGARIAVSAQGELGGIADRPLGSLSVTRGAGGGTPFEIAAEFGDVAAATQRVQVLAAGEIVADLPMAPGLVGSADGWPTGLGKLNLPDRTKCYAGEWPADTLFRLAGVDYRGDELRVLVEGVDEEIGGLSQLAVRAAGVPELTLVAAETAAEECVPGAGNLCLNDGRFRIEVQWQDFQGNTGAGTAVPLTSDTGYFWFFRDTNVELVIKVLDGRPVNGHWWVFYGALSNVAYTITVVDTETGARRSYANPAGTFASRGDTEAFAEAALAAALAPAPATAAPAPATVVAAGNGACSPSGTGLCLNDNRFLVEVEWQDFQGNTGIGTAVPLTTDTGYFWFFRDTNVELVIKVLDGRPVNGNWWVFYGALSNVPYTIRVTDTETGAVRSYFNPSGTFASRGDTAAFPGAP